MSGPAPLRTWLTEPLSNEIVRSVERLRLAEDVRYVALMPDAHLAREVCVGAVVATGRLIYPSAVGGDIGCGMLAMGFQASAAEIDNERSAARVLSGLYERVPANKHRGPRDLPRHLRAPLSDPRLTRRAERDGRVQLGSLGRGNHFLELQSDQHGRLWVMIHSGSRGMGQIITAHHLEAATGGGPALRSLDATQEAGQAYLADCRWARDYARENRLAVLAELEDLLGREFGIQPDRDSLIQGDHNHVRRESHLGSSLWVHRKGAQSAARGELGVIPGSMGAISLHTKGRGRESSLASCSHGAGRRLSRTEARQSVSRADFQRQVGRLWFDHRRAARLRDEAPAAYKNIREVMRAQRELVKSVRELTPVLSYKGV